MSDSIRFIEKLLTIANNPEDVEFLITQLFELQKGIEQNEKR